jgi:hypothetical protein
MKTAIGALRISFFCLNSDGGLVGPGTDPSSRIYFDHHSIKLLDQFPIEYIEKASRLSWLNRVNSEREYICFGPDRLQIYIPDRDDPERRPFTWDRDLLSSAGVYGPQYNRSKWLFEFHSPPPNSNPGWNKKVNYVVDRIEI